MKITIFGGARGRAADPRNARVVEFSTASACLDALIAVPSQECADPDAKLDAPAYALAVWRPGASTRKAAELAPDSATEILAYDLDKMDAAALAAVMPQWQARGLDLAIHSTWKHTAAAPRLRLLVAIDESLLARDRGRYKAVYAAAAADLGIEHDTQTSAPNNLFFLRQHKPEAGPGPVIRWRGTPLRIADLDLARAAPATGSATDPATGATGARPDRGELKQWAAKWHKRSGAPSRAAGLALAAIVRGEPYAAAGHVYEITQYLAWALALQSPDLDEPWFRQNWLEPCWRMMWPGEDLDPILGDWANAWASAHVRQAESRAAFAEQRAALAGPRETLADDSRAAEIAAAHGGGLICMLGSAYYVLDARTGRYTAPVRAGGLAVRARDLLDGLPTFSAVDIRDGGKPCPKPAGQLLLDYGTAIDEVHYYARVPEGTSFDAKRRSIRIAAYQWNEWPAKEHAICADLFRAMAGPHYPTFEAWLSKFRRLERPLPALVLVGPPGVWKSRTAQTLSRFWGDPTAPTACRASHVLGRFSGPLLANPVVWSDERLASDERGKAQPERYRESISEITHQVERKGLEPVTLHSALRHVIAVNDLDLVFSREIEGDAVQATMDRFLVIKVDGDAVAGFEQRWAGTAELARLREGSTMLEHVRWIEDNRAVPDVGRFGIATNTDPDVLARAQFSNDLLTRIMCVATDAVLAEAQRSVPGHLERQAIAVVGGELRLRPRVIVDLWPDARAIRGYRGSTPVPDRVARVLEGAGFSRGGGGPDGFLLDADRWVQWMRLSEIYDPAAVLRALAAGSGRG